MRIAFVKNGSLVLMAVLGFTAIGSLAAEPVKKTPNKETEELRAKVAELEKRVAALEEQLRTAKDAIGSGHRPIELEVVANIREPRLNRFLRCKIVVDVDPSDEKAVAEVVRTKKAVLRTWLIAHLSEQSIENLSRTKGQAKLRENIKREFNSLLYPGQAQGKIREVFFDEFVVQ
jgi:flagellar basal body-associated protein FliL